ncbi:hypothetical protein ACKC9G_17370 [Pokkaliibacter sp. CJK22405]|uniref:hypothetical protein n=1 Tax=Pokkaliibacter sp. CJK22405 TaxID=3384615 RepID=UPI00398491CD
MTSQVLQRGAPPGASRWQRFKAFWLRHHMTRHLLVVLAIKSVILTYIKMEYFDVPMRPATPSTFAQHVYGTAPADGIASAGKAPSVPPLITHPVEESSHDQ